MNHIIVTTLISSEHMRMEDQFARQMLNPAMPPVYATDAGLLDRLVNLVRRRQDGRNAHPTRSDVQRQSTCECLGGVS